MFVKTWRTLLFSTSTAPNQLRAAVNGQISPANSLHSFITPPITPSPHQYYPCLLDNSSSLNQQFPPLTLTNHTSTQHWLLPSQILKEDPNTPSLFWTFTIDQQSKELGKLCRTKMALDLSFWSCVLSSWIEDYSAFALWAEIWKGFLSNGKLHVWSQYPEVATKSPKWLLISSLKHQT